MHLLFASKLAPTGGELNGYNHLALYHKEERKYATELLQKFWDNEPWNIESMFRTLVFDAQNEEGYPFFDAAVDVTKRKRVLFGLFKYNEMSLPEYSELLIRLIATVGQAYHDSGNPDIEDFMLHLTNDVKRRVPSQAIISLWNVLSQFMRDSNLGIIAKSVTSVMDGTGYPYKNNFIPIVREQINGYWKYDIIPPSLNLTTFSGPVDIKPYVEKLIAMAGSYLDDKRQETKQIGEELNKLGGRDAMLSVVEFIRLHVGSVPIQELDCCWNGIGEWRWQTMKPIDANQVQPSIKLPFERLPSPEFVPIGYPIPPVKFQVQHGGVLLNIWINGKNYRKAFEQGKPG